MSYINEREKEARLYCTPPHITKALLKREFFPGSISEPAAGRGDIVRVLRECGYPDVHTSDITDWGFRPCEIENFLTSRHRFYCIVTNPPFDLKMKFLEHAKRVAAFKIAFLLPVQCEYTVRFIREHEDDDAFPWKALYTFPQSIRWLNVHEVWGKIHFGWFVFERGYRGEVMREKIMFQRNKAK
jgi:hypothetical protein